MRLDNGKIGPKEFEYKFMGIFAKNREEWAIADLACVRNSVTIVPIYDTLGPSAVRFIIE